MPIRRVLPPFALSVLLLSSPLLAQHPRPNPSAPAASAASLLPHLRDLAAALWARVVGIPEKGGSGLDPNGLTGTDSGSSLDPDGLTDSGSSLDPNGKT
jgi:hypothetical protein